MKPGLNGIQWYYSVDISAHLLGACADTNIGPKAAIFALMLFFFERKEQKLLLLTFIHICFYFIP